MLFSKIPFDGIEITLLMIKCELCSFRSSFCYTVLLLICFLFKQTFKYLKLLRSFKTPCFCSSSQSNCLPFFLWLAQDPAGHRVSLSGVKLTFSLPQCLCSEPWWFLASLECSSSSSAPSVVLRDSSLGLSGFHSKGRSHVHTYQPQHFSQSVAVLMK